MQRPSAEAAAQALAGQRPRAVVLVEGASDQRALETLASRRGRDLVADGIVLLAMGGVTAIGHFLHLLGPRGLDLRLAGLCDAGEEADVRRALERAGLGSHPSRADMEAIGFHVCEADLEDELVRALGPAAVEQVIRDQDELGSLHTFQRQPQWHGRAAEAQLRRFLGTRGGRKIHYAHLLVDALDLARVPPPLDRLLAHL